jgi:hypothetical protein
MKQDKESNYWNNSRFWRNLFFVLCAITTIGLLANLTHEAEEAENAICTRSQDLSCWRGNACQTMTMSPICPNQLDGRTPGGGSFNASNGCSNPIYECDTPKQLPDGACCNQNDFCYLDDPTKQCLSGQCISTNDALCRGVCEVDSDCIDSDTPFPFYPTVEADTFCAGGACFAYVFSPNTMSSPEDALNQTTLLARNVTACLEMACFIFTEQNDCALLSFQVCQYVWACSRYTGFFKRKRDIADTVMASQQGGAVGQYVMENGTVITVPIIHNFTLPGGARYSRAHFNQANADLNWHLASFLQQVQDASTNAPTAAPTLEPTEAPTQEPTPSPTAETAPPP